MADLPFKINDSGFALLDGKIYASGGFNKLPRKRATSHRFECYDISTKTWTKLASKNPNRSDHSLLLMNNGFLLAVGGNVGPIEEDNLVDKPCGGFIMMKYYLGSWLITLLCDSNIPNFIMPK